MNRKWTRTVPQLMMIAGLSLVLAIDIKVDLDTSTVKTEENLLGSLLADSVRAADKSDVAFVPASAIAEVSFKKGPVQPEALGKVIDHPEDTVSIVRLSGDQIRRALEHGLALYPQKSSSFLQVSGISFTVDSSAPREKRVSGLKAGAAPVLPEKFYSVAMPTPIAEGALLFHKIWAPASVEKETGITLKDALTRHLMKVREVGTKSEERIVFRKT